MKLDDCIKRVERYLNSDDCSPRLVNMQNKEDLSAFVQRFNVGSNVFLPVASYAEEDENPKLDDFERELSIQKGNIFITGLSSYLKLLGEAALSKELQSITAQTFGAHVVVLCYQCERFLHFSDSRAARLVYNVEGANTSIPDIVFILPELATAVAETSVSGVEHIAEAIEAMDDEKLYVITKKHKSSFPDAMYFIKEESKAFDALKNIDSATNGLDIQFGTDEQWAYALQEVGKSGSWGALISNLFSVPSNLSLIVGNWKKFNQNKKWLYFISLKLNGAGTNWCLNQAVKNADSENKLLRQVYRSILDAEHTDLTYWDKYSERKMLIDSLGGSDEEVIDYLQMLKSKEADGLYYLTDSSKLEKERIFELLDAYATQFTRDEILDILSHTYHDLYDYLQPYRFKNKTMYQYFQDYKYQKVINKIYPEFLSVVEEQAKNRDFNLWLSPRSEKIESLNKEGARLYFVDALGVEYLSFILARCKNMNLMADVSLCRCELPSITKLNKEFMDAFSNIAPDIKRLDDIKHHGEESFDYQQTKLPVHLLRELEIVDGVLNDIRNRLADGSIERAYIISDHGASRLTVIHESENQWEMASKGEHSGRCCPIDEADVRSEYATEANGFWVLANYDRFKGGRKASVEVHGGATLEEVVIPIIELTYISGEIEVSINSKLPIEISFRKKAELQLFSKTKLGGVTVCINGKKVDNCYYDAEPQSDNLYLIRMPDVKYAGDYTMTVFSNNNQVAELAFSAKKEGSSERSIL
ncbi:BREX-4 system phosphatase PglZ [Eisenbergiella sp.]